MFIITKVTRICLHKHPYESKSESFIDTPLKDLFTSLDLKLI